MFSRRTGWSLAPNRLHQLAEARRAAGGLLDLTRSNPTGCGFAYPSGLMAVLGDPAGLEYHPAARGLASAREAVASYCAERGLTLRADDLLLTASTSEAYAHLFRLLCNAGAAVLMPTPSYPLFEMLARVEEVELLPAPMLYDQGWHLDLAALEQAPLHTRALLLVHPNNPAGNYLKPREWEQVQRLAAARGWAVVVDEVFCDYPLAEGARVELELGQCPALTFVLNGLSKIAALPQMKLAWIGVAGPAALRAEAMARLEVVNDLFLSAATPVQLAAGAMLAARRTLQPQIAARLRANLAELDRQLAGAPAVERLVAEAGWSVLLRLPRVRSDAAWAELILERGGVLAHPGHFYGMAQEAHLALSLLPPAPEFARGIAALLAAVASELE
ncbi:MAG: pyridoxal phosphate-dependent aminotransferase [Terriglobales bacterium]